MVSGMACVVRLCVVLVFVLWLFRQIRDGKRCPTVVGRCEFSDAEMAGLLDAGTVDWCIVGVCCCGSVQQLHVCIISALCFLSA